MSVATHFTQPMDYTGSYDGFWAGYRFKEVLEYDQNGKHTGVDYNWGGYDEDLGHAIYAVANGIVRWTGSNPAPGFGNVSIIEHPLSDPLKAELACESLFSRTLHQDRILVVPGQEVTIGQQIGTVGKTGTQWAHAHVELYKSTIEGGGVHFRYDSHTQLLSYLDVYRFIEAHNQPPALPVLGPTQAMLRSDGTTNLRSSPRLLADNIVKELPADYGYVDCIAIVRGDSVNGNDLWVRSWSGNYIHSSRLEALPTGIAVPGIPQSLEPPKFEVISNDELTQVVNKKRSLPASYVPSDLQAFGGYEVKGQLIPALKSLIEAAKSGGHDISVISAYRSYDYQKDLYMDYVLKDGQANADKYSARPGHSEHQTGLAVDLCSVEDSFADDPRASWLELNAHRFGFILRYPKGKENITGYMYEPWHFRYVGEYVAGEIHNKLTLEEYKGVEGGNYPDYIAEKPIETKPSEIDVENNTLLKQILAVVEKLLAKLTSIFK